MPRPFTLLTALFFATLLAAPARADLVCKPPMVGPYAGHAVTKNFAQGLSRAAWKTKVTATWGPSWANWSNAKARKSNCRRRTNLVGVNGWVCRATARPCKHQ